MSIYNELLQEFPINDNESSMEYARRIPQELIEKYRIKANNYKVLSDGVYRVLKNKSIKVKRSETLNANGEIITEKFGYIKRDEIEDLSGYDAKKLTTNPNGGQWVKYERKETDYLAEITEIFSNLKLDKIKPFKATKSKKALKITLADMHVGMAINNSLFNYSYGANEFLNSLDNVFKSVLDEYASNGKFDVIIIQDLGDSLDGYNSETTRGGHHLEQNMSNNECFRTFIKGKLNLINKIYQSDIANKVIIKDTANCNHSGDFGYMANYAIKLAVESMYEDIEYTIHEKFMEHFFYGQHCFIQTHGKDKQYMRSGMPLKLDDRTQKFISQYIDRFGITSRYIHVDKGDLHQVGYNKCKQFDYRNYMSLAPPSNWVQHNFGDGYSGYSLQIIDPERKEIKHIDYFLEYDLL